MTKSNKTYLAFIGVNLIYQPEDFISSLPVTIQLYEKPSCVLQLILSNIIIK